MQTTTHCQARMSQRGLPIRLINLVLEYGNDNGDKLILNKKTTQKIIDEIDIKRKDLIKVMDKGGITIVVDNDLLVTAYNTNRHKRN